MRIKRRSCEKEVKSHVVRITSHDSYGGGSHFLDGVGNEERKRKGKRQKRVKPGTVKFHWIKVRDLQRKGEEDDEPTNRRNREVSANRWPLPSQKVH